MISFSLISHFDRTILAIASPHIIEEFRFLNTAGNIGGIVGPVLTPFIASFAGWFW